MRSDLEDYDRIVEHFENMLAVFGEDDDDEYRDIVDYAILLGLSSKEVEEAYDEARSRFLS